FPQTKMVNVQLRFGAPGTWRELHTCHNKNDDTHYPAEYVGETRSLTYPADHHCLIIEGFKEDIEDKETFSFSFPYVDPIELCISDKKPNVCATLDRTVVPWILCFYYVRDKIKLINKSKYSVTI